MSNAQLASELGSLTSGGETAERGCPGSTSSTILKFGKSIPFVELFEAFLVIGAVGLITATSTYYSFTRVKAMLEQDPNAALKAAQIAQVSAESQSLWIVIYIIFIIIAIVFYYFYRRSV